MKIKHIVGSLVIIIIAIILFLIFFKEDSDKNTEKIDGLTVENNYIPINIDITDISNDISNLDIKVNDRIDIYVVSETLEGTALNNPLLKNVRVISIKNSENKLNSISISVPKEVEMPIRALENIPITDYVLKISEENNDNVTLNYELIEIIKENYIVIEGEE